NSLSFLLPTIFLISDPIIKCLSPVSSSFISTNYITDYKGLQSPKGSITLHRMEAKEDEARSF
ncbi:MAG: hypothetical protein ACXU99_15680, partial [Thermodesulfobacteriota bacterium]